MKKLIMVFLVSASVSLVSAQKTYRNSVPVNKNSNVYGASPIRYADGYGSVGFTVKERDAKIRQIKKEYEIKITAVKRNRHLRSAEKQKQISWLQKQRDGEVNQANDHFYASNHSRNKKW